jgi:hypothetical protein
MGKTQRIEESGNGRGQELEAPKTFRITKYRGCVNIKSELIKFKVH